VPGNVLNYIHKQLELQDANTRHPRPRTTSFPGQPYSRRGETGLGQARDTRPFLAKAVSNGRGSGFRRSALHVAFEHIAAPLGYDFAALADSCRL